MYTCIASYTVSMTYTHYTANCDIVFNCCICLQWSTLLYVASEKGHSDVVEALTKAGGDVNVISKIVSQLLGL